MFVTEGNRRERWGNRRERGEIRSERGSSYEKGVPFLMSLLNILGIQI